MSIPACMLLLSLAGAAGAQAPVLHSAIPDLTPDAATLPVTAAAALAADAAEYAAHYGVTLDEAMDRLRAQEASVAMTDGLVTTYRDRLAGISIDHLPEYRIVLLLTGPESVPDTHILAAGRLVPVVFHTGAAATRTRLIEAITLHQSDIRTLFRQPPGLGVDARNGTLVVAIGAHDADLLGREALAVRIAALTQVPVRISVPGTDAADFAAEGGRRIEGADPGTRRRYACTSGFAVTDGARAALATAAHCPDEVDIAGTAGERVPLAFLGQWGAGYQDVQLNLSLALLPPVFHAGSDEGTRRTVTGWRNRTSTRVGDFVCHQGQRSGYSCAEVQLVDYAPPGELCGGPCLPRWVAVAGPHCARGDSGGPVFLTTIAFGLLKGGSYRADGTCNFYYYMSTDYLPSGWTLLYQAPMRQSGEGQGAGR